VSIPHASWKNEAAPDATVQEARETGACTAEQADAVCACIEPVLDVLSNVQLHMNYDEAVAYV
jgi:hypothetical protein